MFNFFKKSSVTKDIKETLPKYRIVQNGLGQFRGETPHVGSCNYTFWVSISGWYPSLEDAQKSIADLEARNKEAALRQQTQVVEIYHG